jgi:hypothetical protein
MTGRDDIPPQTRRAIDELRRLEPPPDLLRSVVLEAETTPQRAPTLSGLRLVAFATAAAMLLVAIAIALPQWSNVGPPRSAGTSPAGSTLPLGGTVDLRIPVPDGAHTGSADSTGIWLGQPTTGLVIRLDLATGAELGRVQVDAPTTDPYDLWPVSDGESVWVGGLSDRSLVQIDIASMEVAARWPIDAVPYRVQPAGGIIWVTDFDGHEVLAVDASDGTILDSVPAARAAGIAVTSDAVYVAGYTGTLVEIDPDDRRVVATHEIGTNATDLAVLDGQLLVWGLRGRPLELIDPLTGEILATSGDVTGVVPHGGQPWAVVRQGMIVRLDPATLAWTAVIPLGDVNTDQLVAAPDRLWAYAATDEATYIYAVSVRP